MEATQTKEAPLVEIPSEPILMWRDQEAIEKYQAAAKTAAKAITSCLREFRDLGLGDLSFDELNKLFRGIDTAENFVREKVTGGKAVKVQGLVFSPEKVKEMVETPEYSEFEGAVANLKALNKKQTQEGFAINLPNFEEIHGEAVLKEEVLEKFIQAKSHYATTEEEKEIFLVLTSVVDRINYLSKKHNFSTLLSQSINKPIIEQQTGSYVYGMMSTPEQRTNGDFPAKLHSDQMKYAFDRHFGRTRY